jgi:hypothetical protein
MKTARPAANQYKTSGILVHGYRLQQVYAGCWPQKTTKLQGKSEQQCTRIMLLPGLPLMSSSHKNKTLATLLAAALGGVGGHRFYLYGARDKWAWLRLATLPLSIVLANFYFGQPILLTYLLLILSALVAVIEALVLGLTPDEKWDARYNAGSGRQSQSSWMLALILVFTVGLGATGLITVLARAFDLLYTGGAYG